MERCTFAIGATRCVLAAGHDGEHDAVRGISPTLEESVARLVVAWRDHARGLRETSSDSSDDFAARLWEQAAKELGELIGVRS